MPIYVMLTSDDDPPFLEIWTLYKTLFDMKNVYGTEMPCRSCALDYFTTNTLLLFSRVKLQISKFLEDPAKTQGTQFQ